MHTKTFLINFIVDRATDAKDCIVFRNVCECFCQQYNFEMSPNMPWLKAWTISKF